MNRGRVYLLHHVHDVDGTEDVKLIGVYSSRERAEAARHRLVHKPGFADEPSGFDISECDVDKDHWTEGFLTVVSVEVPQRGTPETVTVQASRLASGFYQLWPEPERPTDRWLFQPDQIVRCDLHRGLDGTDVLVAVELEPK